MPYSKARKEAVLKKMLPPHNKSVPEISKEEGIPEPTLYLWRKTARAQGRLLPNGATTPEGWTSADKFAAVVETTAMNEEEKATYCRQRGLYPEQIAAWRAACENANDWDEAQSKKLKESMKESKKRTQELERELHRKEKALAEAAALLVLKKKADAYWGEDVDA
jgi:transposase-like protein